MYDFLKISYSILLSSNCSLKCLWPKLLYKSIVVFGSYNSPLDTRKIETRSIECCSFQNWKINYLILYMSSNFAIKVKTKLLQKGFCKKIPFNIIIVFFCLRSHSFCFIHWLHNKFARNTRNEKRSFLRSLFSYFILYFVLDKYKAK